MHPLEHRVRAAVDHLSTEHAPAPDGRRAAAVLLLFDARDPALPLLFIERTAHLRHHAGQIGFPGGGVESTDGSIVATALREAAEELAIPADAVDVVGLLPPFLTAISERWLTPVIGVRRTDIELRPDPFEVARVFSVSLGEITESTHSVTRFVSAGVTRDVHFYSLGDTMVWGVTAAIVHELLERVERVPAVPAQR